MNDGGTYTHTLLPLLDYSLRLQSRCLEADVNIFLFLTYSLRCTLLRQLDDLMYWLFRRLKYSKGTKPNLQNMAGSSHLLTEVLTCLRYRIFDTMADNTHCLRCTILYNPIVDAVWYLGYYVSAMILCSGLEFNDHSAFCDC